MNLEELTLEYINTGYDYTDASSKVCQDIILFKISKLNEPKVNWLNIPVEEVISNVLQYFDNLNVVSV